MKQLPTAFMTALNGQKLNYIKQIILTPRQWDEEGQKYIFTQGTDIAPKLLESGPIKWKMDTEGYAIWNNAATTITLANHDDYFNPAQAEGSSTSRLLHGSMVEFYAGVQTVTGPQYTKIFRSFILSAPIYDSDQKTVTLYLSGELALLKNYSADDISQLYIQTPLVKDAQDPSLLSTTQTSVGQLIDIWVGPLAAGVAGAQLLQPQNHYKINDMGTIKTCAVIKLNNPLAQDECAWATIRCWHTNKTLDWIAQQIAQKSGAQNTDIRQMLFEVETGTNIENTFYQPYYNKFEEGALDHVNISESGLALQTPWPQPYKGGWEVVNLPGGVYFKQFTDNIMELMVYNTKDFNFSGQAIIAHPSTQAYGTWELSLECAVDYEYCTWHYIMADRKSTEGANGYAICQEAYNFSYFFLNLYIVVNGIPSLIGSLYTTGYSTGIFKMRYRISRTADNIFHAWSKPVDFEDTWRYMGILCANSTYTTSQYQSVIMQTKVPNCVFDPAQSPVVAEGYGHYARYGNYITPQIDGGLDIIQWLPFNYTHDTPDGTAFTTAYRTRSDETQPWGTWQPITAAQAPQGTDRYLQLKWDARTEPQQLLTPTLKSWQVSSLSRGILISVVDMSGASYYDIMCEIAQMTGYQIGYDSTGTFLLRPRSQGAAQYTLGGGDIINIESITDNTDKLYNRINVNYGPYVKVVDATTKQELRPNLIDKYGIRQLNIASGNLLPAQNSNIARAIAPVIYEKTGKIKKQVVLITRFLPQLELDDIVEVNAAQLRSTMRIEGMEISLSNWTMRLDLTEI